jgi:hypothetical protein
MRPNDVATSNQILVGAMGQPNKGMEQSKPEYLVGPWHTALGIIESGFAAHAQCWTDLK